MEGHRIWNNSVYHKTDKTCKTIFLGFAGFVTATATPNESFLF